MNTCRYSGGLRVNPTPAGVPVRITSPGNSVTNLQVRLVSLLRDLQSLIIDISSRKIQTAKDKRLFRGA